MSPPKKRPQRPTNAPQNGELVNTDPLTGAIAKIGDARIPAAARSRTGEGKSLANREDRMLTAQEFHQLADVPVVVEWFTNIENPRTRRAYQIDLQDFMTFVGIGAPEEFRIVTRSHVIAWRKVLETRGAAPATIRRKLAALSSLFDYLCEQNAIPHNPVKGVKRPRADMNQGKTPAIGDGQARALLNAPDLNTLKGKRDRAILSLFLFHGLHREEVANLKVKDLHERREVKYFRVHGKGDKIRNIPAPPKRSNIYPIIWTVRDIAKS